MTSFIHSHETIIPILPHFAVLSSVDDEGGIIRSAKFCGMCVLNLERDGLPAEPVTDIISVAVVHRYANGVVENSFEVCQEVWVGEVACFLERVIDIVVGFCVVQVDTKGGLT